MKCDWFLIIKIVCSSGIFGISCKYVCSGNCLNNEICDKIYGECSNCVFGWEGKFCNKSENNCLNIFCIIMIM